MDSLDEISRKTFHLHRIVARTKLPAKPHVRRVSDAVSAVMEFVSHEVVLVAPRTVKSSVEYAPAVQHAELPDAFAANPHTACIAAVCKRPAIFLPGNDAVHTISPHEASQFRVLVLCIDPVTDAVILTFQPFNVRYYVTLRHLVAVEEENIVVDSFRSQVAHFTCKETYT